MLINIRGTSGTGKSTLVKKVMERYDAKHPFAQGEIPDPWRSDLKPRKQPFGYRLTRLDERPLAVLGHYEVACGGCDTLPNYDLIFALVRKFEDQGYDVLFEGLLISGDFPRTIELHKEGRDLLVIGLTEVPLDTCEAAIRGRRASKAASLGREPREFGPNLRKNLEAKYKLAKKTCDQLEAAGVRVVRADRETAFETIVKELRLNR